MNPRSMRRTPGSSSSIARSTTLQRCHARWRRTTFAPGSRRCRSGPTIRCTTSKAAPSKQAPSTGWLRMRTPRRFRQLRRRASAWSCGAPTCAGSRRVCGCSTHRTTAPTSTAFRRDALFPGTPVAVVHESRDGEWWFVVSPLYAAWISKQDVALGSADEVFGYTRKAPYVVVTGAVAHTVFTPERPEVSELQLEMGQRLPVLSDWPADKPVNGQHPYTSYVLELPMRGARWLAAFHAGAASQDGRRRRGLPAADACEPDPPKLQVPRRALRLGQLLQCARLQRLRLRSLSQLRRAAAA